MSRAGLLAACLAVLALTGFGMASGLAPPAQPEADLGELQPAPNGVWGLGDRCVGQDPSTDPLCADADVAACTAAGLYLAAEPDLLSPLRVEEVFGYSQVQLDGVGYGSDQDVHLRLDRAGGLPFGGPSWALHTDVMESRCEALADAPAVVATGVARLSELDLQLEVGTLQIDIGAQALDASAQARFDGRWSQDANIADLSVTLSGSLGGLPADGSVQVPASVGPNTVIPVGKYATLVLNEQHDASTDACQRNTGAALRLIVDDPLAFNEPGIEVAIGHVSTLACKLPAQIVTTPSADPVNVFEDVWDTAVVSADPGVLGQPTGEVAFYVCPEGVQPCTQGGTFLGTGTLDSVGQTASDPFQPTQAGTYCFRGEYLGDAVFRPAVDDSLGECFKVRRIQPEVATTALWDNGTGLEDADNSLLPTTVVHDRATVSGSGATPTGTVTFHLCDPSEVVAGAGCPTGGTTVSTEVLDSAGQALSAGVSAPEEEGLYCFRATYSGDGAYEPVEHTNGGSECFEVKKHDPLIITVAEVFPPLSDGGWVVTDEPVPPGTQSRDRVALFGSSPPGTPTGQVTFHLCGPQEVDPAIGCPTGGTLVGTATLDNQGQATSPETSLLDPGLHCYRATYHGDTFYKPTSHTNPTGECVEVDKGEVRLATRTQPTDHVLPGSVVSDRAWVNATGPQPSGSVTFYLCNPTEVADNGGDCASGGTVVSTNTLVDGVTESDPLTTHSEWEGTWCWRAEYGGDSLYKPATHTNADSECYLNQRLEPILRGSHSGGDPLQAGDLAQGLAWLSSNDPFPQGFVSFFICEPAVVQASGGVCDFSAGEWVNDGPIHQTTGSAVSDGYRIPSDSLGTWCWAYWFPGDSRYLPGLFDDPQKMCFEVNG